MKESVCVDPTLHCGAALTIWVKVVSETEVNCEKRSCKVLLCTRDGRQSEKYFAAHYCLIRTRSVRYTESGAT